MEARVTVHLYGIPNCSTVKKARSWLEGQGVAYQFHDLKKEASESLLEKLLQQFAWEKLLNRQGLTWRKLSEAEKARIISTESALSLMLEKPSIIRRPILQTAKGWHCGFDETAYANLL